MQQTFIVIFILGKFMQGRDSQEKVPHLQTLNGTPSGYLFCSSVGKYPSVKSAIHS